jgi:hypothetical protein
MEDLISELDLFDVQPSKGKFTWSNKILGVGHIASRLDHFLIHSSILLLPLNILSQIVPWGISDHRPIALSFDKVENLGPIPFKFNPIWMDSPDFLPLISSVWSIWVDGTPVYIWEQKLKKDKQAIKDWVKVSSHNTRGEIERYKKKLEDTQEEMDSNTIQNRHLVQEKEHFQNYMRVLHNEEKEWRLKSRALWLQAGDKNTSFFHKQAKARQHRNTVEEIKTASGDRINSFEEIKRKLPPILENFILKKV